MQNIVFFVLNDFQPLDLFGPMDTFQIANEVVAKKAYTTRICTAREQAYVSSEYGVKVVPDSSINSVNKIHTLIFVGGSGSRAQFMNAQELRVLIEKSNQAKRVASVCTGAFILAALDLETQITLATHWKYAKELKESFSTVTVDSNSVYRRTGKYWSSAGITAGIDMSLAMITEDLGKEVALEVAKRLVVNFYRSGNQAQFSTYLNQQLSDLSSVDNRLKKLLAWLEKNFEKDLSINQLAEKINVSSRHLYRLFKTTLQQSPSAYIRNLRMEKARNLLLNTESSIENIASLVGYSNVDIFRKAFVRSFSNTPTKFREQFSL